MPKHRRLRRRQRMGAAEAAAYAEGSMWGHGNGHGRPFRVALAGNPNAGKTSLFNAITGQHQHIGNYPGVTVEKKVGYLQAEKFTVEVVDLPGTYSLSAYSIEEVVTRDFVLREKPDLVVDVLDSTNLERNLYLLLQFQELGVPVVGVLNMIDEAEEQGLEIDAKQLGDILGIPMVKTVGHRGQGVDELVELIIAQGEGAGEASSRRINYGRELESQRDILIEELEGDTQFCRRYDPKWVAIKLLEGDRDAEEKVRVSHDRGGEILETAERARSWVERHFNEDPPIVVAEQRYAYIHGAVKETVKRASVRPRIDITERIDRIALHKYFGIFIFLGVMFLMYQLTFAIGNPLSDLIDTGFAGLGEAVEGAMPDGLLKSLIVDGIIGGVGGVLVFFPLVLMLFMGLAFLEDTGYMARAAFVMDHFFHIFGLHGRSFVPFMIATGCAVPAVMSARTLVNPRDRIITILVTPIMMCGAKTPVVAMLAAAFFPDNAATVFWLVWLAAWLIAFVLALIFRKTLFRGEAAPFVMELPPYRMPTVRAIFQHMWERSWLYVKKAGTFILAASIVIWFLLTFPQAPAGPEVNPGVSDLAEVDAPRTNTGLTNLNQPVGKLDRDAADPAETSLDSQAMQLANSYAGRIGKTLEPVIEPAGFDWKIGVSLFAGFAAKEVIISTMGIVYGIGEADPDVESAGEATPLKQALATDPNYTPATALAMMIFVLIYLPCMATMAVVKKELGSWKWPAFLAVYTLLVAWGLSVAVYHAATWVGLGA